LQRRVGVRDAADVGPAPQEVHKEVDVVARVDVGVPGDVRAEVGGVRGRGRRGELDDVEGVPAVEEDEAARDGRRYLGDLADQAAGPVA
jgi:hypothetical protein